jgi:hypothetical protein
MAKGLHGRDGERCVGATACTIPGHRHPPLARRWAVPASIAAWPRRLIAQRRDWRTPPPGAASSPDRAVIAGWHQRAAQLPACIIRPASADLMLGDPVQQFADPDRGVFARTVTMHERSMVRGRTGRQRKGVHNGVPEGLSFRDGTTVSVNATNIRVRCHALPQKP